MAVRAFVAQEGLLQLLLLLTSCQCSIPPFPDHPFHLPLLLQPAGLAAGAGALLSSVGKEAEVTMRVARGRGKGSERVS